MAFQQTDWPYMIRNKPNDARDALKKAYRAANGNIGDAAKKLGLSRRSFYYQMEKLGMDSQDLVKALIKRSKGDEDD